MNRWIEIIETCGQCKGAGYVEHWYVVRECPLCEGDGGIREQISIPELARLITEAQAMEGAGS